MDPEEETLRGWLLDRARALFEDAPGEILEEAADALLEDREAAGRSVHRPGLAEYLDLLRALLRSGEKDLPALREGMKKIRNFFFIKT